VGTVAAGVLGEIDRENTVEMFMKRLSRAGMVLIDDGPVREAIAVLGEMEAIESVPVLSRILNQGLWLPFSKGDMIRTQAAQALRRIGTSEALAAIRTASRSIRRMVRETCAALAPSAVPVTSADAAGREARR